jgi:hypothetical protein
VRENKQLYRGTCVCREKVGAGKTREYIYVEYRTKDVAPLITGRAEKKHDRRILRQDAMLILQTSGGHFVIN